MSDIRIDMDISSAIANSAKLEAILKATGLQFEKLIKTTVNLNSEGKAVAGYLEAQISANQKLAISLRETDKGWQVQSQAIKATSDAIRRQRDELQGLLSLQSRNRVEQLAKTGKLDFNSGELARIEKIKSAISKLDSELVTPKKIVEFFKEIKAGNIPEATGALAKLRDELVKLANVQNSAKSRIRRENEQGVLGQDIAQLERAARARAGFFAQRYANFFVNPLANSFGLDLSKVSLANEAQIRKVGASIARIMKQQLSADPTKLVSEAELQKLAASIKAGQKIDFINKPELQAASEQISKLIALFERLKKAQDSANAVSPSATRAANKTATLANQSALAQQFLGSGFNNTIQKTLEAQFKIKPSDLTRKQEEYIKSVYANLAKVIRQSQSNLALPDISNIFTKLLSGTAGVPATAELQRVYDQLNKIVGVYERLRQQADRKSRLDQGNVDQTLLSDRAARAMESRIRGIQANLQRAFRPLSSDLRLTDASLDLDKNNKLQGLLRKVSELGAKSQLTSQQVIALFEKFNTGNLGPAEQKFSRIFALFAKINAETTRVRQVALDQNPSQISPLVRSGGGSPVLPNIALAGGMPPNGRDIAKAREYSGIWEKLRNSFDYFVIYRGVNILTDQLTKATEAARKLQIQVSLIRTISQDSQQSFGSWQRDLIAVSNQTGLAIEDVAQAGYDAVSNQVARGRQVAPFLAQAGELARTTNSTLQDSVNLLSSGLNAYGLDVSNAERLSGQFFRTIDLGRVRANELANTFGRVAFVGRDLGASQEELLAVISTLTRNGVTADDAITLLTNGMNKLTNPTEKMQQLLTAWGYSSGRAAVGAEGFTNILTRMIQAVSEGRVELTDLFNEIRGEKFASAFRSFGGQVQSDLIQIRDNSARPYAEARVIRGESDADQITRQMNTLKNALTSSFGSEITNLVRQMIDLAGGVDQLVTALTTASRVLLSGASAYITYKTVTLAAGAATSAYTAITAAGTVVRNFATRSQIQQTAAQAAAVTMFGASTTAAGANTAAVRANGLAFAAHPIGLFLAAGAALYSYWQASTYQIGVQNEALRDLDAQYASLQRRQQESQSESRFVQIEREFGQVGDSVRRVAQQLASSLATANQQLEDARRNGVATSDALRDGFSRYTQLTRDKISEIARDYNRLNERIENSNKSMLSLRELARQGAYQARLQYSGDYGFDQFAQREQLMIDERSTLREQIRALYARGDDESVNSARQLSRQLLDINKALFDLRTERRRIQAQAGAQAAGQTGRIYIGVDPRELERENEGVINFMDQLEDRYRGRSTQRAGRSQASEVIQRTRLGAADRAANELAALRVFNSSGGVLPEFQNRETNRVDINRVREKIAEIRTRLTRNLDPEVLAQAGPEINRLIDDRLRSLETEIQATESAERLRVQQVAIGEGVRQMQLSMQNARTDIQRYSGDITNLAGQLSNAARALGEFGAIGRGGLQSLLIDQQVQREAGAEGGRAGGAVLRFGNFLADQNFLGLGGQGQLTANANTQLDAYQARANAVGEELNRLPQQLDPTTGLLRADAVRGALTSLEQLIARGKELAASVAPGDPNRQAELERELRIPQTEAILAQVRQELVRASANYNVAQTGLEELRLRAAGTQAAVAGAAEGLGRMGPAATAAAGGMEAFARHAASAQTSVADLVTRLGTLTYQGPRGGASSPNGAAPRPPGGNMMGGPIGYNAGGGIGSDNQAIYAQAGEFVWNRAASRRFYSQIATGNNMGRTPIEFTTHEGDTINASITVNEAKDGQMSAAQLQRALRRQSRRG